MFLCQTIWYRKSSAFEVINFARKLDSRWLPRIGQAKTTTVPFGFKTRLYCAHILLRLRWASPSPSVHPDGGSEMIRSTELSGRSPMSSKQSPRMRSGGLRHSNRSPRMASLLKHLRFWHHPRAFGVCCARTRLTGRDLATWWPTAELCACRFKQQGFSCF